ncbi:MAG: hypothetical protein IPK92_21720 [Nitrospira sp.]|nr:hypothetical protein [Nitrospira sp.]
MAFRVLAANQRPDFRPQRLEALAALPISSCGPQLCQRAGLVKRATLPGHQGQCVSKAAFGRMVTDEGGCRPKSCAAAAGRGWDVRDDATLAPIGAAMNCPPNWRAASNGSRPWRPRRCWSRRHGGRGTQSGARCVRRQTRAATAPDLIQGQGTSPIRSGSCRRQMPREVIQGYNCRRQGADLVAADVTDEAGGVAQGAVPQRSMDAGYFSEANVTALTALGCRPLIPPDRQLHSQARPAAPQAPARGAVGG